MLEAPSRAECEQIVARARKLYPELLAKHVAALRDGGGDLDQKTCDKVFKDVLQLYSSEEVDAAREVMCARLLLAEERR